MEIQHFYDKDTFTLTYVVFDRKTKDAVIIDPVLDYDPHASKISTESADVVIEFIQKNQLIIHYILETHAHADHLSSSQYLKEKIPNAKIAIGKNITQVQDVFKGFFNFGDDFTADGSQFDVLFSDNESFQAGTLQFKTLFTPGHTPACASYLIEDAIFTGDTLFMPDMGTGRCDFPAGSAETMYESLQKLYSLPDETRVFVGHDYQPEGRTLAFQSTIADEKKFNIQMRADTTKDQYVEFRKNRDKALKAPRLLLQSVHVNIHAGRLPKAEKNGMKYLKIPLR